MNEIDVRNLMTEDEIASCRTPSDYKLCPIEQVPEEFLKVSLEWIGKLISSPKFPKNIEPNQLIVYDFKNSKYIFSDQFVYTSFVLLAVLKGITQVSELDSETIKQRWCGVVRYEMDRIDELIEKYKFDD